MTPASQLTNMRLPDDWVVTDMLTKPPTATGGAFSVGYKVLNERTGKVAFLKALDFSQAARSADPLKCIQEMLTAFNFERDLLEKCRKRKMSKIITPLATGKVDVAGYSIYGMVPYLIFDLAHGDIRRYINDVGLDVNWCFRSLHHVAIAIKQLHTNDIAHQDVKPSNVLVMTERDTRVGDLGRASDQNVRAEHDSFQVAGDVGYAPIDLWYGNETGVTGFDRRFLTDIYLLGSMIFFYFSGVGATYAIQSQLTTGQRDLLRRAPFKQVLPYVQDAFQKALYDLKLDVKRLAPNCADEVMRLARELCEPDPVLRGDPKWRTTSVPNYDLSRVVSALDILSKAIVKKK